MTDIFLGLDYGHVRIGVALANGSKIAMPCTTIIKSQDPTRDTLALASAHKATCLVVGLPRNLDGEDTVQTTAARAYAASLADQGYQVQLQDEAGTSSLVEERMQARGKPYKKEDIDQEAAIIILQDYLDSH